MPPGAAGWPRAAAAVAGLKGPLAAPGGLRAAGQDLAGKWEHPCGNGGLNDGEKKRIIERKGLNIPFHHQEQ